MSQFDKCSKSKYADGLRVFLEKVWQPLALTAFSTNPVFLKEKKLVCNGMQVRGTGRENIPWAPLPAQTGRVQNFSETTSNDVKWFANKLVIRPEGRLFLARSLFSL